MTLDLTQRAVLAAPAPSRRTSALSLRLLAGTAILAGQIAAPSAAHAQAYAPDAQGAAQESIQPSAAVAATPGPASFTPVRGGISLSAGSGQVIHLRAAASNVFTADPKVAEVRPASANSLFVFGVAPGVTTVAALSAAGDPIAQYQVTVQPSGFDASQARGAVIHSGAAVNTRATETGVSLTGHVATPGDAERAYSAARGSLPADAKVDNHLGVSQSIQVGLHVRIAEMTRTLVRELGINWTSVGQLGKEAAIGVATNTALVAIPGLVPAQAFGNLGRSGTFDSAGKPVPNLSAVIDALSQDQLVHVLAEPNLTTMSGQPASFLVGGEFPIPVATSNNTISIAFKQYGISLAFVPTVISADRISMHVRPEVSQLDKANGVTSILNNNVSISIPALTVRRADTTVELGSGQSFAIAGLLSDQTTQIDNATPGIGDIPILGALFRSTSFQRQETELVIVVTPYIVRPVSDPGAIRSPTSGYRAPNDLERILLLRQLGQGYTDTNGRIPVDAGFIVE